MAEEERQDFGAALRAAIVGARYTQARLAKEIGTNATQVSRWVNNRARPHVSSLAAIEKTLGVNLMPEFQAAAPQYELFVSAPITGLHPELVGEHHDAVKRVVEAARAQVNSLYWPGEEVSSLDDLRAADLATTRTMTGLQQSEALLYLQFEEVTHPSGALVEVGIALGMRKKVTALIRRGLDLPYMLEDFTGVARGLQFLPDARIYTSVVDVDDAIRRINRNGRELLGLG